MGLNQWQGYDFEGEIETYFKKRDLLVSLDVTLLQHVTDICFQSLVGWNIGLPNQMTLIDLGLITMEHNRRDQLTEKGRAFVWRQYRKMRVPLDTESRGLGKKEN